ncbi:MAG: D-2-hydroxyacid dehydrogenase [Rikenellaceae bacterium]
MKKIVFLDAYSVGDSSLAELEKLGDFTAFQDTMPEEVVERARGAEVVITNKVKLFRDELEGLKSSLKLICVAATGTNNIDMEYARECGITVKNVPAYSTVSVSEATFAFVLGLCRGVSFYNDFVHSGEYSSGTRCFNLDYPIWQISGKRWGVVGLGAIGNNVAQIAKAFGAEVCYYSTSGGNNNTDYQRVEFKELLQSCDIITIHAPLNDKTHGLFSTEEFSQMKPTSIIVNMGRGGIIDEVALATALNKEQIAGAALDVFTNEPLKADSPLLSVNEPHRLLLAPHSAWSSKEARERLIAVISKNISE